MIEKSELLRIPAFEGLPDDQLDWFISQTEEIRLKAGDMYLQQGDPAISMVVILEGELQMRGDIRRRNLCHFRSRPGASPDCCLFPE